MHHYCGFSLLGTKSNIYVYNKTCIFFSKKTTQGLEYADLSFAKKIPRKGQKPIIHGADERTIYSDVDHTKRAPPLPQENPYEETNIGQGQK